LGIESREAGQSLVPAPPHMMVGLIIARSCDGRDYLCGQHQAQNGSYFIEHGISRADPPLAKAGFGLKTARDESLVVRFREFPARAPPGHAQ
jgi:hypothetical protein